MKLINLQYQTLVAPSFMAEKSNRQDNRRKFEVLEKGYLIKINY